MSAAAATQPDLDDAPHPRVPFVHLRVHSEYSIADGLISLEQLAHRAAELSMPAVALTDRSNLHGLIKFYQACLDCGVKPILGLDLRYPTATDEAGRGTPPEAQLTALACNPAGCRNLMQLATEAQSNHQGHRGLVSAERIFDHGEGLILLSGARDGEIGQALLGADPESADHIAQLWAERFPGRFYLELQRTGRANEERYLRTAVELAARCNLPVVATNEVCFLQAEDFEAHETRVCIQQGRPLNDPHRARRHSASQFLKSAEDMTQLFADLPEALANSMEIAKRCTAPLALDRTQLPNYPVPPSESLEAYLERQARAGLAERLKELRSASPGEIDAQTYAQRLDYELRVINQMGFPGYFLIVMEFIAWARKQGIPVGPGRGSGAGSLVAYALRITDLDPMRYDLLFERFLNPERVSLPDFDVDFCMERRDEVINHVSRRYGQKSVSQIISFGTMGAKAVVRDVARAQGKPYGLADKLSKLIPHELGMTLKKAMEQSEDLRTFVKADEEVAEIMDMAYKLEGVVRNASRHAGGVVIAPAELTEFVPLCEDESGGGPVSQFDKDDVERAGLVKFDFLGLKTLTVIDWAAKAVNAQRNGAEPLRIERIPLDDPVVFDLLKRGETTGVFQLESRGMKELIQRLKPDCMNDIIASVALYRPGPLQSGAVEDYINRKHGKAPVRYPHPALQPVLESTFGVVLYQEQVMQIAQVLAGFSLGQADLLRRAMGKKKPAEMAKVRQQFVEGAAANGVDGRFANELFDLMEKFAGYAFNKSHSATYALIAYQTAWLKARHPAQFMAAILSADMQNIDKVVPLVEEVRRMGLELKPPSVNLSEYRFSARDGVLLYGLGAVRGLGEGPVRALTEARASGPFANLADFCLRVDALRSNRRAVEALIHCGAMDEFAEPGESLDALRGRLLHALAGALQGAEQAARDADSGMTDLFGGPDRHAPTSAAASSQSPLPPLSASQRLNLEKEALGLYLTGHPIDDYLEELDHFCIRLNRLEVGSATRTLAGFVVSQRARRTRRGAAMGVLVIDDRSGRIEATLFSEVWERDRHKLEKGRLVVLEGEVQPDEFSGSVRLRVEKALSLEEARRRYSSGLQIDWRDGAPADAADRLLAALEPFRSEKDGCPVSVLYRRNGAEGRIRFGARWRVRASDDLMLRLRSDFGDERVRLAYPDG